MLCTFPSPLNSVLKGTAELLQLKEWLHMDWSAGIVLLGSVFRSRQYGRDIGLSIHERDLRWTLSLTFVRRSEHDMGKYCVKLMCGSLWSHHSSLVNLRLASLADKCSPTSTSLTDIGGAVPTYTSSTSAPTSLHNCSWLFPFFFFFSSPQVKRNCAYSRFVWEMPLKLMISWWLLLIFATVHILSPWNSSLYCFQSWAV